MPERKLRPARLLSSSGQALRGDLDERMAKSGSSPTLLAGACSESVQTYSQLPRPSEYGAVPRLPLQAFFSMCQYVHLPSDHRQDTYNPRSDSTVLRV